MKRFTVFGRSGCGYCLRAKELLDARKYPYHYVDIHEENIGPEDLAKTTGKEVKTVPQIFHGEQYVGGYAELDTYLKGIKHEVESV